MNGNCAGWPTLCIAHYRIRRPTPVSVLSFVKIISAAEGVLNYFDN